MKINTPPSPLKKNFAGKELTLRDVIPHGQDCACRDTDESIIGTIHSPQGDFDLIFRARHLSDSTLAGWPLKPHANVLLRGPGGKVARVSRIYASKEDMPFSRYLSVLALIHFTDESSFTFHPSMLEVVPETPALKKYEGPKQVDIKCFIGVPMTVCDDDLKYRLVFEALEGAEVWFRDNKYTGPVFLRADGGTFVQITRSDFSGGVCTWNPADKCYYEGLHPEWLGDPDVSGVTIRGVAQPSKTKPMKGGQ